MTALALATGSALWLGVLTSVSPCPLATNLAAVSFLGRQVGSRRRAVASAGAYVLGRALAYAVIGALVVAGVLSIPGAAGFLERYMNRLLGPILVLAGMALLGLLPLSFGVPGGDGLRDRAARSGLVGALLLGVLFALSFCPVSAALFFGSLVPLSIHHQSTAWLPLVFGVGTGLPVFALALVLAFGAGALGGVLRRLDTFQRWATRATGVVFVGVGLYYTVMFIFLAP
ncbi:MAG: aromatic aminobenezylarsenical efflux permease ArsG family transporter [Myxococcota bacterium]